MTTSPNDKQQIVQPSRRSLFRRKWDWHAILALVAVVGILIGFLGFWLITSDEKPDRFLNLIRHLESIKIEGVEIAKLGTSVKLSGDRVTSETILLCAKSLPNIEEISFFNTPGISDSDLQPLTKMKSLQSVHLYHTRVSGDKFPPLEELPNLKYLFITQCPLTESGLERLLKIKQLTLNSETIHLESIKLRSAEITNLDGSKPPRVNSDSFQIKGSFTSTKFLPIAVGQVYLNDDDTYYLSNTSTVIRGNDGTYDFNIKAQFATSTPGSYKIDLGVRFDARANAWFRLGTVEFEAK